MRARVVGVILLGLLGIEGVTGRQTAWAAMDSNPRKQQGQNQQSQGQQSQGQQSQGQQNQGQQRQGRLRGGQTESTEEIDRLLQEARRAARQNNQAAAITAYEKALVLVRKQNNRNREGDILTRLGRLTNDNNGYEQAAQYYQQALTIAQAIGNQQEIFQALLRLGTVLRDRDNPKYSPQQALAFFQKALDLGLQLRDANKVQQATRKLVSLARKVQGSETQQRDRILTLQTQALNAAKQFGNSDQIISLLQDLAETHDEAHQYPEALAAYQQALTLMDQQLARISTPSQSQQATIQPPAKSQLWGQNPRRTASPDDDSDDDAKKSELQDDIIDLLIDIARVYKRMAQPDGVNQSYQKIQSIALQSNDLKFKTETLARLARRYRANHQYEQAIVIYQTLLKSLPTSPQPTTIPEQTNQENHPPDNDPDETDDWDWDEIEHPSQYRLTLLMQLSVTYNLAGNLNQADQILQQARQTAKTQFGSLGELQVLLQVAELYKEDFARYETAQIYYQQASTLAQSLKRWTKVADIGLDLGEIYLIRGPYPQAVQSYEQALRLYRETDNRDEIDHRLLSRFGLANYHLGNYAEALKSYNQALEKDPRPRSKARLLNLLGTVYQALGQPQKALTFYSQALQISSQITPEAIPQQLQKSGSEFTLLDTLDRLGTVYQALNQPQKALQSYQQALDWLTNTDNREDGDDDEDTEDRDLKARLLNHLGLTQQSLGQNTAAIAAHNQALSIFRQTRNLAGEASALHNLGLAQTLSLAQNQGQPDLARQSLQQALGLRQSLGDLEGEATTLNALGTLLDQQQQPQLALLFYKQSVNTYESIRQFLRPLDRSLQQSYTDSVAIAYRRLADRLIAQGRIGEAQTTLELLKLQELNDFSRGTRSAQPAPLAYSETETKLKTQYGSLIAFGQTFSQCERQQCPQLPQLRDQLRNLNRDFDQLVQTLTRQQTESETQKTDDFLTSADKIVNVQPHTVLIYPLVLEDKVWLLWAAQGVTGKAECPLDRPTLNQTVATFRQALLDPTSSNPELHLPAQKLYDCLIRPLEPELQKNGIQHLIFVPDRVTNYIPMAALHDGQRYLIERYSVANILSAKLTDVRDRLPPQGTSTLAFGLSEAKGKFSALPYVLEEIDNIVKSTAIDPKGIYPGQTLLNGAFSRNSLEDSLSGQQILHIATHAAFVASNPRESYLVLGTGETYPIPEIQRLRRLREVHLVVLSACETGVGGLDANGGIEVSGISSYFLEDRAKAVLASLWKVNDESTSLFMQAFYQGLSQDQITKDKITKAESMRQSQLGFLQGKVGDNKFTHPYYWAPFVMIGNSW